ncbi:FKBP-type peptidyl-prolyl cis-trans isomerase [Glacieibacterium megasporae]|uniref:FKBP-type peptidyl-prolyl cis-trans isomerase n=2 Tax=Sphingosinicellaceae TaxID=2820280 RepID=UPI001C1E5DDF|nr:FKBP-type peptidyl-prolyl cis-trans isomerase [Polymorphobacter megasporae]UAJ10249.1 FKBP-type peptidyl-prolyl cis-trans isomerase [Polymorphobacter megasporae]
MTATAAGTGAGKWVGFALVLALVVAVLVWAGTQRAVDSARPADLAYLSAHKGKPGVKTTASGLQYEIVTEGTGPTPTAADTVAVHYEGKLLDGTVFDSSIARGQPAVFPLNRVIPGWTEGVQLMKVGSVYNFTIPPELGYGAQGAGGVIPPNAVLLFRIELLGVQGKS